MRGSPILLRLLTRAFSRPAIPLAHRAARRIANLPTTGVPLLFEEEAKAARTFTDQEMASMKRRFETLAGQDSDSSKISPEDIQTLSAAQGIPVDLNTAMIYINEVDRDGKGHVSWEDFMQMVWEMKTGECCARLASMCFPERSLWDDENLEQLLQNNRDWVQKMKQDDPEYFSKLKHGQQPQYLFIGCADSRVPAQELLGMKAGEMFVHRNVANLVVSSDLNLLSVISYAVEVLRVKDIIVCGHYDCGGVKAAHTNKDHGLVEHWICNIRDVARLHATELMTITDPTAYHRRMVELNVLEQCVHLFTNPIIQRRQAAHGLPRIHGFVYDVGEGLVKKMETDFKKQIRQLRSFYDTGHFQGSQMEHRWRPRTQ